MNRGSETCRVYWGTHGCGSERGHDGPHRCSCADEPGIDPETREYVDEPGVFNVGAPPYYGPGTTFYGEDATPQERGEARGSGLSDSESLGVEPTMESSGPWSVGGRMAPWAKRPRTHYGKHGGCDQR